MSPPNIQVLQARVEENDDSDFRLLIDGKFVKYVIIDAGVYKRDEMSVGPTLVGLLPPLPPGDWKEARVSHNSTTGQPYFSDVSCAALPDMIWTWHPTRIDHLDLVIGEKLGNNVYEATSHHFDTTVIVKLACFE